jgi:hypothetical protein
MMMLWRAIGFVERYRVTMAAIFESGRNSIEVESLHGHKKLWGWIECRFSDMVAEVIPRSLCATGLARLGIHCSFRDAECALSSRRRTCGTVPAVGDKMTAS